MTDRAQNATEQLVFRQQISVPYQYTAGPVHRAFLRALAQQRILGSRHDGGVLVPARPFGPDGRRTGELVEVSDVGTVTGFTTRVTDTGRTTFALVLLDGATVPLLHVLDGQGSEVRIGMRVRARWAERPEAEITAIASFVPTAQDQ